MPLYLRVMIIYNVTTQVHHKIHHNWLTWLKAQHIPAILKTACFIKAVTARLLETDDTDGVTYTVQYYAENKELYDHYIETYSDIFRRQAFDEWGSNCIAFRSVMEVIN